MLGLGRWLGSGFGWGFGCGFCSGLSSGRCSRRRCRFCSRRWLDWLWCWLWRWLWLRCGRWLHWLWRWLWLRRSTPLLLIAAQHGSLSGHWRVWGLLGAARWNVGRWQHLWFPCRLCCHRHWLHHFLCAAWRTGCCCCLRAARRRARDRRQRLVCAARHGALLEGTARIVCWNGIHGARWLAGCARVLRARWRW